MCLIYTWTEHRGQVPEVNEAIANWKWTSYLCKTVSFKIIPNVTEHIMRMKTFLFRVLDTRPNVEITLSVNC